MRLHYISFSKKKKKRLHYILLSKDKPEKVFQQRKAMEPRLVEIYACIVAPHGCHPQSQSHWFQEKENDTCTLKKLN